MDKKKLLERTSSPADAYACKGDCATRHITRLKEPIRWQVLLLALYTAVALAGFIWALHGPKHGKANRVLEVSISNPSQKYSQLGLSIFLMPGAVLVRKVFQELASLHPFAIAAEQPVWAADLDKMTIPGLSSIKRTSQYSWMRGLAQFTFFLVGALLGPIGALCVGTEMYTPQDPSTAIVGLPLLTDFNNSQEIGPMCRLMGYNGIGNFTPTYSPIKDMFLRAVIAIVDGKLYDQNRISSRPAPALLGPVYTPRFKFEKGVRYEGLVTFTYNTSCELATGDISFELVQCRSGQCIEFTFPDGSKKRAGKDFWGPFSWTGGQRTEDGIPLGGTTYWAWVQGPDTLVAPSDTRDIDFKDGFWFLRAKCSPSMQWHTSSCTYDGEKWGDCSYHDMANGTALDTIGLNALSGYLNAVPWVQTQTSDVFASIPLRTMYGVPSLHQLNEIGDMVAESLVALATGGIFGNATVNTMGGTQRLVYVARVPFMAVVVSMLFIVTGMGAADLISAILRNHPIRRFTFLTIATAVRGDWWDNQLYGGCLLKDSELQKFVQAEVMFGVDAETPDHVGLAPDVLRIDPKVDYFGAKSVEGGRSYG